VQNGKQILNNFGFLETKTAVSENSNHRGWFSRGGTTLSSFSAAGTFVFGMPVLLLTLDGAVGSVPAAVVHGLLLTVVALQGTNESRSPPRQAPSAPTHTRSHLLLDAPAHAEQYSSFIYAWGTQRHEDIFHTC